MNNELPVVTVYIPSKNQIIQIEEGSGCNILNGEDRKKGIIDYINYSQFNLDEIISDSADGGQIDFDFCIRDKYSSLTELIDEVLNSIYDETEIGFIILSEGEKAILNITKNGKLI